MSGSRWVRRAAVSLVVGAGALGPWAAGCGGGDGLVGGDCADGYARCGSGCCPVLADGSTRDGAPADGTTDSPDVGLSDGFGADRFGPGPDAAMDAPTPDGASPDATPSEGGSEASIDAPADAAETGPLCVPPLVDCQGVCVDTTNDPFNCGQCGDVCPSQICVNSLCTGSTAGGIVFIGHDYLTTPQGTAQARVLTNAVFVPQNNPLHVLSYERYASATATARVRTILTGFAGQVGRGFVMTSTSVDADIPSQLTSITGYQVLVVNDQLAAPAGALASLGASWASTLAAFARQGGIVVVLDGGTGVGEMPAFSTATTLLSVTGQSPVAAGTPLDDVAPGDVVGVGVVSPYGAGQNSVSLTTEANGGNVIFVIDLPSDAAAPSPVVVHKLF